MEKADRENQVVNRIRSLRMDAGVKQQEVADFLGVGRSTYCHYETGRIRLSADQIARLAGYYHVPLESILQMPEATYEVPAGEKTKNDYNYTLSQDDLSLLSAYHRLGHMERQAVWQLIHKAYK